MFPASPKLQDYPSKLSVLLMLPPFLLFLYAKETTTCLYVSIKGCKLVAYQSVSLQILITRTTARASVYPTSSGEICYFTPLPGHERVILTGTECTRDRQAREIFVVDG